MITDVEVRDAGPKGRGAFALRAFRKGEFIFRRRHSRVVTSREIPRLSEEDRRHLVELDLDRSAILLPPGCYLNHSCEPNAMDPDLVRSSHPVRISLICSMASLGKI